MPVLNFLQSTAGLSKTRGQQLVELAQSAKPRKDDAALGLAFYHDEQRPDLLRGLAKQFRNPQKFQLFFLSLVRKSSAGSPSFTKSRRLDRTERDQTIAAQLWQKSLIDVKLKKANRYTKLLKTCLVRAAWCGRCHSIRPDHTKRRGRDV